MCTVDFLPEKRTPHTTRACNHRLPVGKKSCMHRLPPSSLPENNISNDANVRYQLHSGYQQKEKFHSSAKVRLSFSFVLKPKDTSRTTRTYYHQLPPDSQPGEKNLPTVTKSTLIDFPPASNLEKTSTDFHRHTENKSSSTSRMCDHLHPLCSHTKKLLSRHERAIISFSPTPHRKISRIAQNCDYKISHSASQQEKNLTHCANAQSPTILKHPIEKITKAWRKRVIIRFLILFTAAIKPPARRKHEMIASQYKKKVPHGTKVRTSTSFGLTTEK